MTKVPMSIRLEYDLIKQIEDKIKNTEYKDVTHFIEVAIKNQLDPARTAEITRSEIIALIKKDKEIRQLLNLK